MARLKFPAGARAAEFRGLWRRTIVAAALLIAAAPSWAQSSADTFFMVLRGRVTASASVAPRDGDSLLARVGAQTFTTTLNGAGEFSGLSISKVGNDPAPITFQMRQSGATYTLVESAGGTQAISVPFAGLTNPLSAAFNAQTVNMFVGPRVGGSTPPPGTGGDDDAGDPRDVDRNGMIEVDDARLVMEFIVGQRSDGLVPDRFDANEDGRINTDDVIAILRANGQEAEQPAATGGTQ